MELEQLRHFLKVASLGNFTRAAEAVGLSQPALSRSIARLEEVLGQPVFERQTRQVALTEAGRLLLPRAQQILSLVEDTQAEICDDGQRGQVRLAAIPTVAPYFLPPFLRQIREQLPFAHLVVQEDTTEQLLKKLAEGVVDMAILARPIEPRYLALVDLFEEELFLVLAAAHPLSAQAEIDWHEIEGLPFVLLGEAHCLTENVLSFCHRHAVQPISVERTSQLSMVQELVALNHGVSLVPEMARRLDTQGARVYRRIKGERPSRKLVLAYNPYRFQSRLVKQVREKLAQFVLPSAEKRAH